MFGLAGCSVPVNLKAEILLALAALAKSPEIASNLWQTLEISQVRTGQVYWVISFYLVHNEKFLKFHRVFMKIGPHTKRFTLFSTSYFKSTPSIWYVSQFS